MTESTRSEACADRAGESDRAGRIVAGQRPARFCGHSREWSPVAVALAMEAVDIGMSCGLEEGLRFESAAFGLAAAHRGPARGNEGVYRTQASGVYRIDKMARTIEGNLDARGLKFAIVAARFNSFIVDRLLEGALDAMRRTGGDPDAVIIVKVPGSWEMPVVAAEVADRSATTASSALAP